jgi:DNA polymerase
MAPDGYVFVCSDYSSIESMGLNHQAGEEWVLDAFRRGECVYKHNAARILGKPYTDIDDDERQKPGKISELASGYQGSAGAVRKFDAMPGVSDAEIIKTITQPWRDAHPMVVAFWKGLESAAKEAIRNPGKVFSYREIRFASDRVFLRMRLPSGRCIHYFQPGIDENRFIKKNERPEDHPEDCTCDECGWYAENIYYWGMKQVDGKTTTQFAKVYSYGGKLVENAIQGLCRDIMCDGGLRVEKNGFPVVFTVHDEVISLVKESEVRSDTLQVFEQLLSEVPSYVTGLPLIAKKGWIGKRYRK